MKTFSFTGAKKIVFGRGSFASLPEHIIELKIMRPLIVLDKNLAETGFGKKIDSVLAKTGIGYVIYDKTAPERYWP
jgi:alcohol dehydrogenase class IV